MDGNTQITEIKGLSPSNNVKSHDSPSINFNDFQSPKPLRMSSSQENSMLLGNHGGSSHRLI